MDYFNTQTLDKVLERDPILIDDPNYFSPMAIGKNCDRCDFTKDQTLNCAVKNKCPIFQILAEASKPNFQRVVKRFGYLNDDYTSKLPLILNVTIGMWIMLSYPIKQLKGIVTKGTIGQIIGIISDNYVDKITDEHLFNTFHILHADHQVEIKRYKRLPKVILLKIRGPGSDTVFVVGYPAGVVAVPCWHGTCKITMPSQSVVSGTLSQFPMISTYAMTPEKLQGVTLPYYLFISALDRHGFSPQTFYVALSRVCALHWLVFTQPLDLAYIRKFAPPKNVLLIMKKIITGFTVSSNIFFPANELTRFEEWRSNQLILCEEALKLHADAKTRNKKSKQSQSAGTNSAGSQSDEVAALLLATQQALQAQQALKDQQVISAKSALQAQRPNKAATLAASAFHGVLESDSIGILRILPADIRR